MSDPSALDMYYNGEYAGALDGPSSTIGRLNQRAAQLSAALDAHQGAQGQGSALYKAPPPAPEKPQLAPHSDAPIPYMPGKTLAPAPVHPTPKAAKAAASSAAATPAPAKPETPKPEAPKPEASSSAAPEAPTDTPVPQ